MNNDPVITGIRELAKHFDELGDVHWYETPLGTNMQVQVRQVPESLALFARELFGGRLTKMQRYRRTEQVKKFYWTISGKEADALMLALLPHVKTTHPIVSFFCEARKHMHDELKPRGRGKKYDAATKKLRHEIAEEMQRIRKEVNSQRKELDSPSEQQGGQ